MRPSHTRLHLRCWTSSETTAVRWWLLLLLLLSHLAAKLPESKMVVTSRMLAAHVNGYPVDAKARFWSNYYRSLKGLPPVESYWDNRYHQRRTTPPRFRDVSEPWYHFVPVLRPSGVSQEYLPPRSKHDISLRPSFLSPVKRTYAWSRHPQRLNYCLQRC